MKSRQVHDGVYGNSTVWGHQNYLAYIMHRKENILRLGRSGQKRWEKKEKKVCCMADPRGKDSLQPDFQQTGGWLWAWRWIIMTSVND